MDVLRAVVVSPVRRVTWRRWVYLVLGGAVMAPFVFVAAYGVGAGAQRATEMFLLVFGIVALVLLAAVTATGALETVRKLEIVTARELLGGAIRSIAVPERLDAADRWRGGLYFTTHLVAGGVIGALTITMVPLAFVWLIYPLTGSIEGSGVDQIGPGFVAPLYGAGLLIGFGYLCAGLGALLARLAPRLLGPSRSARIEQMERVASDLAERNRLARDLHDSVGHSLSVVTLQAGAARRMWHKDPDFAYEALGAVEQSARTALGDLDHVLGLLREETTEQAAATLLELDTLLRRHRGAGASVELSVEGALSRLPVGLSREAYLVVQESLTNASRHAPGRPVRLDIDVQEHRLLICVRNPMPTDGATKSRPSGGRGVRGMRERIESVGGTIAIGADGGDWRTAVAIDWEAS